MYIAFGSKNHAETAIKRLEDDLNSKINNLRTEWMQYLVSIEDVRDKIDHLTKRNRKRSVREDTTQDSVPEEPEVDEISRRVAERRRSRGLSA